MSDTSRRHAGTREPSRARAEDACTNRKVQVEARPARRARRRHNRERRRGTPDDAGVGTATGLSQDTFEAKATSRPGGSTQRFGGQTGPGRATGGDVTRGLLRGRAEDACANREAQVEARRVARRARRRRNRERRRGTRDEAQDPEVRLVAGFAEASLAEVPVRADDARPAQRQRAEAKDVFDTNCKKQRTDDGWRDTSRGSTAVATCPAAAAKTRGAAAPGGVVVYGHTALGRLMDTASTLAVSSASRASWDAIDRLQPVPLGHDALSTSAYRPPCNELEWQCPTGAISSSPSSSRSQSSSSHPSAGRTPRPRAGPAAEAERAAKRNRVRS
jgi:hypothetical protein